MIKIKKSLIAGAIGAALTLSAGSLMAASNTQGGLIGHAMTKDGSSISQATVTIKNTTTGLSRSVQSDENGNYKFPLLPAGTYKVSATKMGSGDSSISTVKIRIGQNATVDLSLFNDTEVIEVRGTVTAMIDPASTESVMIIDSESIERLPIARDIASVALLAPGTGKGDSAFGNLAYFSGASVGENAYYINGLNTTNFRNGLGGSDVPFEFYDQFEVKSGGYGAEYGRSTGGVVTAITKSGGNESKFGFSAYWEPDALNEDKPDIYKDGEIAQLNSKDESDEYDINLYASGALIEDTLFYYALVNPRSKENNWSTGTLGGSNYYKDKEDSVFWGLNVDWYINDDNIVELTAFSDARETDRVTTSYDSDTDSILAGGEPSTISRGGDNLSIKYTSLITDDLQISTLLGLNRYDRTDSAPGDICPRIYDSRDGGLTKLGCWATATPSEADDERKAFRLDVDYAINDDHQLRFGLDYEINTSNEASVTSGGRYYRYYTAGEGGAFNGALAEGQEYYRLWEYKNVGSFETETSALYIEDTWQASENIVLTLGLRNETFNNKNVDGDSFIKVSNQLAPRLGASWDVSGLGQTKVFAHLGRYYLPVASNTNMRLAGSELYTRRYFPLDGLTSDFLPTNDYFGEVGGTLVQHPEELRSTMIFGTGEALDTRSIVDKNIEPMYQDELIIGAEHMLNEEWKLGLRTTYRNLATSIEDIAIDAGLQRYADENSGVDLELGGFDYYVLTNPGNDMNLWIDADGDGELDNITLTADQLGYPEAERQFASVDFTFERAWDGKWMLQGSYTWSHSWGNSEGAVRSDNGQDDAGLTTNFDQPGLTDGAKGNLPNDKRHMFKVFGSYAVTEQLNIGAKFAWQSGRPKNAFGYHPTDEFAQAYGSESFFNNGELVPRGSLGNTNNTWSVDLNAKYNTEINGADVSFALNIFNVFNNDTVTEVSEIADNEDSGTFEGVGTHPQDQYFGVASNFQTPRYVRLSTTVRF